MKIDGHPREMEAMAAFLAGDHDTGIAIQDEFVAELHASLANKEDHCSCTVACKFHGKCLECVAIHRGHRDHLPDCFHDMMKQAKISMD